jgi:hypothetical protein
MPVTSGLVLRWAGGPHLDESLKMGAPGLDFQTWDSVDTQLARELGIEVSHVSESRHGAPNILSIQIGILKRPSVLDQMGHKPA